MARILLLDIFLFLVFVACVVIAWVAFFKKHEESDDTRDLSEEDEDGRVW